MRRWLRRFTGDSLEKELEQELELELEQEQKELGKLE